MAKALAPFVWFLWQSSVVGGYGAVWFWPPFVALSVALVWTFVRAEPIEHWKLALLALLPMVWIFVGIWGGYFWLHWERPPVVPNPAWVLYPVKFGIWVYLALAIGLVAYLRGARWFAALFALLNLYFMLTMTFLAGMAVTGDWL